MGKRLILKASAGTGKTYRLSLEYIASLVQGIDFKDILVMTFTKKATGEIKERILEFLRGICTDEEKREEIEKNLQKIYGDSFILEVPKVKKLYKNIVENKDKLKIYTIDSFTNNIFKKAIAPYLKIYSYEIIDEEENKKILIKTFEKLFENREDFNTFKSFLEDNSEKNMDIYVELIGSIISQRWKSILIGDSFEKKELLEYKESKSYLDKMEEVLQEVAQIKGKPFQELIKKGCQNYFISKDREGYLKENYPVFLEGNIWNGVKVRSKKGDIDSQIEDLNYLYEEFRDNLGREMYNNLVVPYEEKLLKTIEKIYTIYDEIKFREKRFTHTDISSYTFKYLQETELGFIDENGVTDEFFEIIDGKLKSIFIDEFQDTSILQWRILKNILDKSENIICVGDEKQSIYGWRGGEKRLFENLDKIILGEVEELDTCFRSKENIVKYTNEIFENIGRESLDLYPLHYDWKFNKVGYREKEEKGFVKLLIKEEEKDIVETLVEEIEKKFSNNYSGIGILARTKKTLERIAFVLGERGIPYTLESDTKIVESNGIFALYSLINWLVKRDFLALLDFLRSDLVNISALKLKKIIESREEIESYLYLQEENLEIEEDIFTALRDIYANYRRYNGETEFLTYEMILRVGIGNRFQKPEETLNIFGFYKLLKEYKYFSDFLIDYKENDKKEKFKKLTLGNNNSISLMTIHKSKGLEFDTVLYFIPTKQRNRGDRGMEFYLEMDRNYSNVESYLITDNKFNKILESVKGINYLKEREIKREHEEINNLYVALTRPKNNLFLVVESVEDIEKSNFSTLLKSSGNGEIILETGLEKQEKGGVEYELNLSTPMPSYKEDVLENQQEGLEKLYTYSFQLEKKRLRGIVVHYFLENLLKWKADDIELAKKLTYAKYATVIGEEEMRDIFSSKNIEHIYEKSSDIFKIDWDFVYREYPVYLKVDGENKNYRLDRLMIKLPTEKDKGIIYIVDYKTGKYDEEQLNNYTQAVIERVIRNGKSLENFEIRSEYIELDI